jgi:hypothetical protein
VRWLDRGPEREEVLLSISTDGRLVQWSTEKGLEHTVLLRLRRVPHHIGGGGLPPAPRRAEEAAAAGAAAGATAAQQLQQRETQARADRGAAAGDKQQPAGTRRPPQPDGHPAQEQRQEQREQQRGRGQQREPLVGAAVERDAFISRSAGGLCFDFSPRDGSIYLAGERVMQRGLARGKGQVRGGGERC